MTEPIGVVGAGTMGAGIAQVAAVAGRRVLIADAVPGAAERAVAGDPGPGQGAGREGAARRRPGSAST